MERIKLHDKFFRLYIPNEKIEEAIRVTAEKINRDFGNRSEVPVFLSVLNGSFMFTAELLQEIRFDCEISFIRLASYEGDRSTGKVKQMLGCTLPLKGRKVIIIEDIIDTGQTMNELIGILKAEGAAEIKVCTLFYKPASNIHKAPVDYCAMEIGTEFIVGYGLDYNQLGRQYRDIYIIDE